MECGENLTKRIRKKCLNAKANTNFINPTKFNIMISAFVLLSVVIFFANFPLLGHCRMDPFLVMKLEGCHECQDAHNSAEIEHIARFAVQEHSQEESALQLVRVLKAREEVVSGKMYYLLLEVVDNGKNEIYEAKVWVKPWINFKHLQEFKIAPHLSSFTANSDDCSKLGWKPVSARDQEVEDAAYHAHSSIQKHFNSPSSDKLLEILSARAKIVDDNAVFDLLLKTTSGIKVDKFRVEVKKNIAGKFCLNQAEQVYS